MSKKINDAQSALLIELVEENFIMLIGKHSTATGGHSKQEAWNIIMEKCNEIGPLKTVQQWKRAWMDLKASTKLLLQKQRRHQNRTGGGPISTIDFTPQQEKIINLCQLRDWDGVAIAGIGEVDELLAFHSLDDCQKQIIVEMVEKLYSSNNKPNSRIKLSRGMWTQILRAVNEIGTEKTLEEISKAWKHMKLKARQKCLELVIFQNETKHLKIKVEDKLSNIEVRIGRLLGVFPPNHKYATPKLSNTHKSQELGDNSKIFSTDENKECGEYLCLLPPNKTVYNKCLTIGRAEIECINVDDLEIMPATVNPFISKIRVKNLNSLMKENCLDFKPKQCCTSKEELSLVKTELEMVKIAMIKINQENEDLKNKLKKLQASSPNLPSSSAKTTTMIIDKYGKKIKIVGNISLLETVKRIPNNTKNKLEYSTPIIEKIPTEITSNTDIEIQSNKNYHDNYRDYVKEEVEMLID